MKYIVPKNDLADLKAKLQSWMTTIYHEKYYHKVKKCFNFVENSW
ncbi:hypothetical protein [Spiroplasma endosymbiont of Clivina fossor]